MTTFLALTNRNKNSYAHNIGKRSAIQITQRKRRHTASLRRRNCVRETCVSTYTYICVCVCVYIYLEYLESGVARKGLRISHVCSMADLDVNDKFERDETLAEASLKLVDIIKIRRGDKLALF